MHRAESNELRSPGECYFVGFAGSWAMMSLVVKELVLVNLLVPTAVRKCFLQDPQRSGESSPISRVVAELSPCYIVIWPFLIEGSAVGRNLLVESGSEGPRRLFKG